MAYMKGIRDLFISNYQAFLNGIDIYVDDAEPRYLALIMISLSPRF